MFEKEEHEKLFQVLIFLVKLSMLSLILYAILWWVDLTVLREVVASQLSGFFRFFNFEVMQEGTTLLFEKFSFSITEDCTGWKGLVLFFALVAAVKSPPKKKILGLVVNIPILYSVNILRIVVLIFITRSMGSSAYSLSHDFLWQATMIVTVLCLWFVWLDRAKFIIEER